MKCENPHLTGCKLLKTGYWYFSLDRALTSSQQGDFFFFLTFKNGCSGTSEHLKWPWPHLRIHVLFSLFSYYSTMLVSHVFPLFEDHFPAPSSFVIFSQGPPNARGLTKFWSSSFIISKCYTQTPYFCFRWSAEPRIGLKGHVSHLK